MTLAGTYVQFSRFVLQKRNTPYNWSYNFLCSKSWFSFGFHVKAKNLRTVLKFSKNNYSIQAVEKVPNTMKITSEQFQSVMTQDVKFLQELFKQYGFEIRIAGGAVRDLLLGIVPKDLDFATTATPEEMRNIFTEREIRTINLKGESHGTVTARINEENYEITTLRIDKETDGRHALVEFTKNWYLDASRRDLTINAMFLDFDGTVYDYFNGVEHLKESKILFVGDASHRIREDYLRILRYFRFHGRISKNPDEHDEMTMTAIRDNAKGLEKISGERIQVELYKILSGNNGIGLLKKILSLDIAGYIGLPENNNFDELNRVSDLIKKHNLSVDPITILCTLFETESDVEKFCCRIKTSAYHRDLAYFIVEQRNRRSQESIRYYRKLTAFSKNPKIMKNAVVEYLMYMGEIDILNEFQDWELPLFPIRGFDIQNRVLEQKRWIGTIRNELLSIWIDSDFKLTKQELINLIPEITAKCVSHKKDPTSKTKEHRRLF